MQPFNYNVKPIDLNAYFRGADAFDKREAMKHQQTQNDEIFALKKQQLEQSVSKTPDIDMKGLSGDLSQWIGVLKTNPQMAMTIGGRLIQKYPYMADDIKGIATNYQSDPEGTIAKLEELNTQLAPIDETKVGRYRTEQVGSKLVQFDTATGEQTREWHNPKMSQATETQLNNATNKAFEASQTISRMNALESDLLKYDISAGTYGSMAEYLKDVTGNQDIESQIKMEARAIRNSQVVRNLPPGVASDKDIEMALKGFPSDNANAEMWVSFLRGQRKLAMLDKLFNEHKADYISENMNTKDMYKSWVKKTKESDFLSSVVGTSNEFVGFEIIDND